MQDYIKSSVLYLDRLKYAVYQVDIVPTLKLEWALNKQLPWCFLVHNCMYCTQMGSVQRYVSDNIKTTRTCKQVASTRVVWHIIIASTLQFTQGHYAEYKRPMRFNLRNNCMVFVDILIQCLSSSGSCVVRASDWNSKDLGLRAHGWITISPTKLHNGKTATVVINC